MSQHLSQEVRVPIDKDNYPYSERRQYALHGVSAAIT